MLGATGLAAHRHARPRPDRDVRRAPATSPRATRSARAMLSLRAFMFERVYLGPETRGRARARARDRPRDLRRARRPRRRRRSEITEFIAGMTDRFALEYAARLSSGADQGHDRRGGQAGRPTSSRSSRSARRCARPARGSIGRCPFHEERTPSFSVNPVERLYYCFGCGKGGDMIRFVRETQGLDFVGAVEWLADRFRIPIEYEETLARPRTRGATGAKRLYALLDAGGERSTSATSGTRRRARFARDYLAGRGLARGGLPRVPARARARRHDARAEGAREGLHGRGAARGGPRAAARRRLLPAPARSSRSPTRAAACSASRRGGCTRTTRCRRSTSTRPSRSCSRRARSSTGSTRRARAIAREDRACVVEGNTDVIALRQAGFEPVVACMGTALTEQQLRELGRLTKRLWLAFDGDAAGESATLRGMELAGAQGFDVKVVALPPGIDPADDPAGFEARLAGGAARTSLHRTQVEARSDGGSRGRAPRGRRRSSTREPDSLNRRAAWRLGERPLRDADPDPRRRDLAEGRSAASTARRGGRQGRARRARGGDRPSGAHAERSPRSRPSQFSDEQHRALRNHLVDGARGLARDARAARRARLLGAGGRGDRQGDRRGLSAADDRAGGPGRARRQADYERLPELSARLVRIRETIAGLERQTATAPD